MTDAKANYQYFGLGNVNQYEPPSLESSDPLKGFHYQNDYQQKKSYRRKQYRGYSRGHTRALASTSGLQMNSANDIQTVNAGWRTTFNMNKTRTGDANYARLEPQTLPVSPQIVMIDRKKEESPLKEVQRVHFNPKELKIEEKNLKTNMREKVCPKIFEFKLIFQSFY